MFPYNFIIDFTTGGYDYLGYAKNHKIDSDKLEIFKLDKKAYIPIVLALYLIIRRFSNTENIYEQVYVDSLMKVNIQPMLDCKALTIVNNSALITTNNSFEIPFNTEDIISNKLGKKYSYNGNDKTRKYDEVGSFLTADYNIENDEHGFYSHSQGPALKLIKYFSNGFKYDVEKTFVRNNLQLTTNNDNEKENKSYVSEMVGNKARMEMLAYYQARKQLAECIKNNIDEEFKSFGGKEGVTEWFKEIVQNNYDNILNILTNSYINNMTRDYNAFSKPVTSDGLIIYIKEDASGWWTPFNKIPKGYWSLNKPVIDETNGKPCNFWFCINVNNSKGFKEIIGKDEELPKIMECYDSCRSSLGNHLLSATDEVTRLYLPYEDISQNKNFLNKIDFTFSIGFSKSGWNKIIKEAKNK